MAAPTANASGAPARDTAAAELRRRVTVGIGAPATHPGLGPLPAEPGRLGQRGPGRRHGRARVEDWFINLLAPTIERQLDAAGALTWCPQWWQHPEAIARLEALWRAWEVCRDADGEAPSRRFWQYCDPHLAVLMDAKTGPLSDCKPDEHGKHDNTTSLPFTPAPAGYCGTDVAAIA